MLINYTSLRDLARKPKEVINEVKKSKKAKIIVSKQEPQAVIVSLEDYHELEQIKAKKANLNMLQLALNNKDELKNLPVDLREKAGEILYGR